MAIFDIWKVGFGRFLEALWSLLELVEPSVRTNFWPFARVLPTFENKNGHEKLLCRNGFSVCGHFPTYFSI